MIKLNPTINTSLKVILLSGNPGTGKTSLANRLKKKGTYEIIHIGDIVISEHLYKETDEERDTKIVDAEKLNTYLMDYLKDKTGTFICESHYTDLILHSAVKMAIILRVKPEIIINRLKLRNYSAEKIRENAEAEFLGDCTSFMLEREELYRSNRIFEIDATNLSLDILTEIVDKIIKYPDNSAEYLAGRISWLSNDSVNINNFI